MLANLCDVQDSGFEASGRLQPGGRAAHSRLHRPRLLPDLRQLRLRIQHGRKRNHRYVMPSWLMTSDCIAGFLSGSVVGVFNSRPISKISMRLTYVKSLSIAKGGNPNGH